MKSSQRLSILALVASVEADISHRTEVAPLNTFVKVKDEFDIRRDEINNFVFQTLHAFSMNDESLVHNESSTSPSRIFTYNDFFDSLRSLSVSGVYGQSYHIQTNPYRSDDDIGQYIDNVVSDKYVYHSANLAFYVSQTDPYSQNALWYGIVNICAFLANAMVESIQYDSCEELNGIGTSGSISINNTFVFSELNAVNGRYFPASNACGQYGNLYEESGVCFNTDNGGFSNSTENVDMSCSVDTTMGFEAAPHPKYNAPTDLDQGSTSRKYGPPPFHCEPKNRYPGYWDGYSQEFVRDVAYPSALGKIDVEGCCYWGRGALSTKNVCNLGKLNYYMGSRAYREGRPSRYPNIDFCKVPWVICGTNRAPENGLVYTELKWMAALFEWIERIQSYENTANNWDYMTQLKLFVDRGGQDLKFIDVVSSLVARGCDEAHCSTQPIPFIEQRRRNFEVLIYDIFDIQSNMNVLSTSDSTNQENPPYNYEYMEKYIQSKRSKIEGNIFVSQNEALDGTPYFSTEYRFNSFILALRSSALYGLVANKKFFLGDVSQGLRGFHAGLFNLVVFLANVKVESIAKDSCDEVSWEKGVSGTYSTTNSCGQNGRDYTYDVCPDWQSYMTCKINPLMEMEAQIPVTDLAPFISNSLPDPLKCYPGNGTDASPVKSCCWWGRGALATSGRCNMGKLNFHLGARAKNENRPSIYPDINFCSNPDAICSHKDSMEIRWVVAMFEWIDRVQTYYHSETQWQYMEKLYDFVDGGMQDISFLEAVNSIVATGCHLASCETTSPIQGESYRYGFERKQNVLNIIRLVFDSLNTEVTSVSIDVPSPSSILEPAIPNIYADMEALRQLFPSTNPTASPTEALSSADPTSSPFKNTVPTTSPVEFSNITVFNDGLVHVLDGIFTYDDGESLVITDKTNLTLAGGNVTAPENSEWPAIRLSVGSAINATAGVVRGSNVDENFDGGGEGIQLNNGQSSTDTAGYGEFYDGVKIMGGNGRIGGDALIVNGFGTEAFIYGGEFMGGSGINPELDGYSLRVINSAVVYIHGGTFIGDIKVEDNSLVYLYGCFMQNETEVTGLFAGDIEVNMTIDGEVVFIKTADQECETFPPTSAPTLTPPPTPPTPSGINRVVLCRMLVAFQVAVLAHLFNSG